MVTHYGLDGIAPANWTEDYVETGEEEQLNFDRFPYGTLSRVCKLNQNIL